MKNLDKKIELSKFNKIWEIMQFYESDWFLWEFIDFVWFYWKWKHERLLNLLKSDNGWSLYLSKRLCLNAISWFSNFRAMVSVSVYWSPINIVQLREIKLNWEVVLDIDIYWKGCKLIREEWIREELYLLFTYYLWMESITLTRADYTVDCQKMNFRKSNTLNYKKSWLIKEKDEFSYMTFGKKSHDSAKFLRYYDKKLEIKTRHSEHLYPEYSLLPSVMRYELQVNSKWFDKYEREIKIDDLFWFITLQKEIESSKWKHLSLNKYKDWSLETWVIEWIKKLQKKKDIDWLERVKLVLLWKEYLDYENAKCEKDFEPLV